MKNRFIPHLATDGDRYDRYIRKTLTDSLQLQASRFQNRFKENLGNDIFSKTQERFCLPSRRVLSNF